MIGATAGSAADGISAPAVRCVGLVKQYPDVRAVDGLDLEVHRGECFGLLGPNGAGKTTTVEILEGLTPSDGGTVELFGRSWGSGSDHALRQRLGIQLQESELSPKLTVRETVRLFRSLYPKGRPVEELIDLVELRDKQNARFEKLSGGQKQRLALATALAGDPDILFLDEPTTGLDPQARLKIWELVEQFLEGGGTVLLTTHYMEEAARLCSRVGIIDQGRVIALGSPDKLIGSLGADQIVQIRFGESQGEVDPAQFDEIPGVGSVAVEAHALRLSVSDIGRVLPRLFEVLADEGLELTSLKTHQATLEDVFVHLTGRALRDE